MLIRGREKQISAGPQRPEGEGDHGFGMRARIGKTTLVVAAFLVIVAMALQVCRLNSALESALDTAGSLQIRYVECEGDRVKLQTAVQSCNAEVESLSADIQDVYGSELIAERRWR
jgi:hypothetical protein